MGSVYFSPCAGSGEAKITFNNAFLYDNKKGTTLTGHRRKGTLSRSKKWLVAATGGTMLTATSRNITVFYPDGSDESLPAATSNGVYRLACIVGNILIVCGGRDGSGDYRADTEAWDLNTGTKISPPAITYPRFQGAGTCVGDKGLFKGGENWSSSTTGHLEIFTAGLEHGAVDYGSARHLCVAESNDYYYALWVGGIDKSSTALNRAEMVDINLNYSIISNTTSKGFGMAAGKFNDKIIVGGGTTAEGTPYSAVFDVYGSDGTKIGTITLPVKITSPFIVPFGDCLAIGGGVVGSSKTLNTLVYIIDATLTIVSTAEIFDESHTDQYTMAGQIGNYTILIDPPVAHTALETPTLKLKPINEFFMLKGMKFKLMRNGIEQSEATVDKNQLYTFSQPMSGYITVSDTTI